jgi:Pal1 cell morphology protein
VRARASSNPTSSRGSYPNTPTSAASPRQANYRQDAFAAYADDSPRAGKGKSPGPPNSSKLASKTRSRGSSLGERFPGDRSGQPLDILRRESKRASRASHLKKKHIPGTDVIDKLDVVPGRTYHHEGPYDATLLARNTSWESSPVAAVQGTNEEALKATPRENIIDAVERHRPLDGTAYIPPGGHDRFGRVYDYEEGSNMMIENGGNYKRWPEIVSLISSNRL